MVGWCIGWWFFMIFNDFIGFQVDYYYIVSGYDVIIDVGWFNY